MKNRFRLAAVLLALTTLLLSGTAVDVLAYDILNSKWNVGPNNATFINPAAPPATPGAVTWSPMPSGVGLHPDVGGFDGHGDLTTDIEFLITPAVDGLEYSLFNDALNLWGQHASITNLGQVADSGAQVGAPESLNGHIGDIRAAGFFFDGPGGGLAHALQPATESMGTTFGGDVHFDIGENWTNGGGGGTDFLTVAIHELGHSLGLGHSSTTASVMYFAYQGTQHNLFRDDIIGIQEIYGADFAANASFDSGSDTNVLNVDFGSVIFGDPIPDVQFEISNLQNVASTATLSHASTTSSGDTSILTTDFSAFNHLVAGTSSSTFNATFNAITPGSHSATYDFNFTDITGTNQTITLNMMGEVQNFDNLAAPDLVYNPATGELFVDPRDISTLGLYALQSDNAFLSGNHNLILGGVSTSLPQELSEASFSTISTPQSIGNVLATGLSIGQLYDLFTQRSATAGLGSPEVQFDIDLTCGAGDANCDGYVDISFDILPAFSNFTGPGTFSIVRENGDVSTALGDDDVDVDDILTMFGAFTGPPPDEAGLGLGGPAEAGDPAIPDLIYDATTGEVVFDLDGAAGLIGYSLKSAGGFLAGGHTPILGGVTTSLSTELAEAALSTPGLPASIGFVFPIGMDLAALMAFLTDNTVSTGLGAPLVPFDLVVVGGAVVPEPATVAMALFGLVGLGLFAYRRRRTA